MTATDRAAELPAAATSAGDHDAAGREAATSERLRVPAADGFRGYAALAVLLIHVFIYSGFAGLDHGIVRSLLASGFMGVDFFFVLSGLLLFLPTVTSGGRFGNVRSYAIRRAARILPAYYLMLVGIVVLRPLVHHPLLGGPVDLPTTSSTGVWSLLLHVTFLEHTVGQVMGLPLGFALNAVVWTLSIEALFYLLLPLVAGWYYRRPFIGLVIALAVSSAWKPVATSDLFLFVANGKPYDLRLAMVTQLPTYAAHFATGMTAAWLIVKLRTGGHRLVPRLAVPIQALAAAFILLTMRSAGNLYLVQFFDSDASMDFESWTHTTRVGIAFAVLLVATAVAPPWAQWPATNRLMRRVGDVSYGIYLWHIPIILLASTTLHFTVGTDRDFFWLLGVTLVGSLVAGWLSFVLVERPFVRWAQRRTRARPRPPDPPSIPAAAESTSAPGPVSRPPG